jgi:hypothetical protein
MVMRMAERSFFGEVTVLLMSKSPTEPLAHRDPPTKLILAVCNKLQPDHFASR